jgi:hypothetical protein
MQTTWMPHEKHGRLTEQSDLPDSVFAFPKQRKEPLTDEQHVRNAVARFDQVTDVAPWRSPTSRRLQNITMSTFRRRHGTSSASIRNSTEKRLPPKALRPGASAET